MEHPDDLVKRFEHNLERLLASDKPTFMGTVARFVDTCGTWRNFRFTTEQGFNLEVYADIFKTQDEYRTQYHDNLVPSDTDVGQVITINGKMPSLIILAQSSRAMFLVSRNLAPLLQESIMATPVIVDDPSPVKVGWDCSREADVPLVICHMDPETTPSGVGLDIYRDTGCATLDLMPTGLGGAPTIVLDLILWAQTALEGHFAHCLIHVCTACNTHVRRDEMAHYWIQRMETKKPFRYRTGLCGKCASEHALFETIRLRHLGTAAQAVPPDPALVLKEHNDAQSDRRRHHNDDDDDDSNTQQQQTKRQCPDSTALVVTDGRE